MTFYFAWVDSSETTFNISHERYDENVFALEIEHREGECATCLLTIKNPRVGLLSAGRKVWAWLSWRDGTTVTPLLFGRLVGIPDMQGAATGFAQTVVLHFIAKPTDLDTQRRALAESLAVLPWYDPVFIDENLRITIGTAPGAGSGDIDAVLEARSARFHIDRTSLQVTISDIIIGEDGTEIFESTTGSPACIPPESISLRLSGTPQSSVTIKAQVTWDQDTTNIPGVFIGNYSFLTLTGGSLLSSWPKPGASVGGGWAAATGTNAIDVYDAENVKNQQLTYNWRNGSKTHVQGDSMSLNVSRNAPVVHGPYVSGRITQFYQPGLVGSGGALPSQETNYGTSSRDAQWVQADSIDNAISETTQYGDSDPDVVNIPLHYEEGWGVVPYSQINATLYLGFDQGRARTEHINFTMTSDVQPVLIEPDIEPDANILEINGADVGVPIDGVAPIFSLDADSYFPSERGMSSIEYLLLRGRAILLNGARVIELSFDVPFYRAIALSCRKNAQLVWDKLPGGQATGKIVRYVISANAGKLSGQITIACTVGRGFDTSTGAYGNVTGTPTYVDNGYVDPPYQVYSGAQTALPNGDIAYSIPVAELGENTLASLNRDDIVVSETTHGDAGTQASLIENAFQLAYSASISLEGRQNATSNASALVAQNLKGQEVWHEIVLRTVADLELENAFELAVEPLLIPQTIDLESG